MHIQSLLGAAAMALRDAAKPEDDAARAKLSEQALQEGICKALIEKGEALSALSPTENGRQFCMHVKPLNGDVLIDLTYHRPLPKMPEIRPRGIGVREYYMARDRFEEKEYENFPALRYTFARLHNRHKHVDSDCAIRMGHEKRIDRKPHWILNPQIDSDFCVQKMIEWCGLMAPDRITELAAVFASVPSAPPAKGLKAFIPS